MDLMAAALSWLRENLFVTAKTPEIVATRLRLSLGLLLKRVAIDATGGMSRRLVCADKLADEVAVLIRRGSLDACSPVGVALGDYREPPATFRSDRLAGVEEQNEGRATEISELHELLGRLASHVRDPDDCESPLCAYEELSGFENEPTVDGPTVDEPEEP